MKNEVKVAETTKWTAEQIEFLKGELKKAQADLATATAKVAELEKAIAENATEALKNEMKMWKAQVEVAEGLIANYEKDLSDDEDELIDEPLINDKAIVEYNPPAIEPDEVLSAIEAATAEKLQVEIRCENLSEFNTLIEEEMEITNSRLDNSLSASIANPTNENIRSYIAFADRRILLEEIMKATDKASIEANDAHIDSVLNIEKARVMSGLKYAVYVENTYNIIVEHKHTIAEAVDFISKQNDFIEWWIDKGVIADGEVEVETIATGENLDAEVFEALIDQYDMKFTEGEIVASATSPVNADLTHDDTLAIQTTQSDTNTAKNEIMSAFEPVAKPDREKQDYGNGFANTFRRNAMKILLEMADNLINQISAYKTANFP